MKVNKTKAQILGILKNSDNELVTNGFTFKKSNDNTIHVYWEVSGKKYCAFLLSSLSDFSKFHISTNTSLCDFADYFQAVKELAYFLDVDLKLPAAELSTEDQKMIHDLKASCKQSENRSNKLDGKVEAYREIFGGKEIKVTK